MHLWTICAISCEVGYVLFYGAYVGYRPDSEPQYMLCCFVIFMCVLTTLTVILYNYCFQGPLEQNIWVERMFGRKIYRNSQTDRKASLAMVYM